jgi:hypothetical protein
MSVEMDVGAGLSGVGVPGAGFGTADIETDTAATQSGWDEGSLMVIATTAGVLAASLLAVCVNLS